MEKSTKGLIGKMLHI